MGKKIKKTSDRYEQFYYIAPKDGAAEYYVEQHKNHGKIDYHMESSDVCYVNDTRKNSVYYTLEGNYPIEKSRYYNSKFKV